MEHIPNKRRYRRVDKMGYKRPIPSFEYFIDEDKEGEIDGRHYKGIVVAKMKDADNLLCLILSPHSKYSFKEISDIYFYLNNFQSFFNPFPLVGVAHCFDDDNFSIEKGKELARAKCWSKYYYRASKVLEDCEDRINDLGDFINEMKNIAWDRIATAETKIYNIHNPK